MTRTEVEQFLAEPGHLVRVGSTGPEGPLVNPAWFLHRDGQLYVTPRARAAWLTNLRANPSVCFCIDEDATTYRRVTVRGVVRIVHLPGEDEQWRATYRDICLRYWDGPSVDEYLESTRHLPRALVALPFSYDDPGVTTWRAIRKDEDYAGIWAPRYWEPVVVPD